jgi:hypothetical protein
MKSFKTYLLEAGGRMMMGVNPLQMNTRDLLRFVKKWKDYVSIETGAKHHKLLDNRGNVFHTFTVGRIGPKAALGVISTLRDHLVSRGLYELQPNERQSLIARRQNTVQNVEPQHFIDRGKIDVLKNIVSSPATHQRRKERILNSLNKIRQRFPNENI